MEMQNKINETLEERPLLALKERKMRKPMSYSRREK
jgi:hypothetical protein